MSSFPSLACEKKNCVYLKPLFDPRKLGASEGTINQEIQRYQQLESVAVNDIRRDVRKKLRRSSMRVNAHLNTFPRELLKLSNKMPLASPQNTRISLIWTVQIKTCPWLGVSSSPGRLSKGQMGSGIQAKLQPLQKHLSSSRPTPSEKDGQTEVKKKKKKVTGAPTCTVSLRCKSA